MPSIAGFNNRIGRRLNQARAQRRDPSTVRALIENHPPIGAGLRAEQLKNMGRLARDYSRYVSVVSSPNMAMSLHTAGLIASLCDRTSPRDVLDLGSGFSTYVLSAHPNVGRVVSIDDDAAWLRRTNAFLEEVGVTPPEMMGDLSDFLDITNQYDFVSYDLGRMPTRRQHIAHALDLVKPGGIAVLDDLHKYPYSREVRAHTKNRGQVFTLYRWTRDHIGRYSGLWVAPT